MSSKCKTTRQQFPGPIIKVRKDLSANIVQLSANYNKLKEKSVGNIFLKYGSRIIHSFQNRRLQKRWKRQIGWRRNHQQVLSQWMNKKEQLCDPIWWNCLKPKNNGIVTQVRNSHEVTGATPKQQSISSDDKPNWNYRAMTQSITFNNFNREHNLQHCPQFLTKDSSRG